jgi:spore germination protein YaaH
MTRTYLRLISLCCILALLNSCKEAIKLKSSIRKTETEARLFKNTLNKIERVSGVDQLNLDKDSVSGDVSIYAPSAQKSMLNQYGYIYDALNKDGNPIKSNNFKYNANNSNYAVRDTTFKTIKDGKEVFGWHPYWMGDSWKQYPFELLTTISYFSYKVDPATGSYTNPEQIEEWNTTTMIDSALAKNTKVLLTISCHGNANTSAFLDNPDRWSTLIETVSPLLMARNANGLDINFESLSYFKREKFNQFIAQLDQELSNSFEQENKKFFLSITLPAVNSRDIFDVKELDKYADLMTIMGYDYNTGNQVQGPVAPLRSKESSISLETTLDFYIDRGINLNKTVLALPYYGSMWDGKLEMDGGTAYNATKLERKVTYSEIRKLLLTNTQYKTVPILDEYSMTNYYNLTYADNTTKEVWYDDAFTLGKKYDYVMSKELRGVGIWALGYDNGSDDLWKVIEDRFSTDIKIYQNPIASAEGYPLRISRFFIQYKSVFVVAAVVFFIAVCFAFGFLLTDWRIRESILRNKLYQWIFLLLAIVCILPVTSLLYNALNELLPYFNMFIKPEWQIYIAFTVGMLTLYLIKKIKIRSIERP